MARKYNFKNKARLTSDNYEVILHMPTSENKELSYNLTNDYGMTTFSWESKDELEVINVCTRPEPVSFLHQKGFDLDFQFARENMDELMSLLIDQYNIFWGNNPKTEGIASTEANQSSRNKLTTSTIGKNIRTTIGEDEGDGLSLFSDNNSRFVQPIFRIEVKAKQFTPGTADEKHGLMFYNVTLYRPFERVNGESGFISYGFKGFSTDVGKTSENKKADSPFTNSLVDNIENKFAQTNYAKDSYMTRAIVNPDNAQSLTKKLT